jgi:hypothetical protein
MILRDGPVTRAISTKNLGKDRYRYPNLDLLEIKRLD